MNFFKHSLRIAIAFIFISYFPTNGEFIVGVGSGYGWKIGSTNTPEIPSSMSPSESIEYFMLPKYTNHSLGNGLKIDLSIKYYFSSNLGIGLSGNYSTFGGWEKTNANNNYQSVKSDFLSINPVISYRFTNIYVSICPGFYLPKRHDSLFTYYNSSIGGFYGDLTNNISVHYIFDFGYGVKSIVGYNYNLNKKLTLSAELFFDYAQAKVKEQNYYYYTTGNKLTSTLNYKFTDQVTGDSQYDYLMQKPEVIFHSLGANTRLSWTF